MKIFRNLLITCVLSLCFAASAFAASGVTTATANIGGATAQVTYVTMGGNRAIVPAISNNSIHTVSQTSSTLSTVKSGSVVAAINGGFFNSYYNTSAAFSVATGNYPRVYSTIVKEGQVICAGGDIAAIGMDYNGKVYIDKVKLSPTITLRGTTNITAWGANIVYTDPSAVYILTDIMDYPVNIPATSKIVTIQSNKVTSVSDGKNNFTVPQNTIAIVYGQTAYANALKWESNPKVGDAAVYRFTATPSNTSNQSAWNNMRTVIAGGGMLVKNGQNVVDSNTSVTAADQKPDAVAQRSFVAQMSDGRLMMGTVVSSFRKIANSLVSMGAKDAIFMDGGASSMLYANGTYLTHAGRQLATVMAIVDETVKPTRPNTAIELPPTPAPEVDEPSSWAQASLSVARGLNMLPEHLDKQYKHNITRKEFCDLIAAFIRAKTGYSIEYFCTLEEVTVNKSQFSDSKDYYVPYVAALGIVGGYPDGTFHPKDSILRQDAAIMLQRLAIRLGVDTALGAPRIFRDNEEIASYARSGIAYVTSVGIMNGGANNTFSPRSNITREQAVITMINAYDNLDYTRK